MGFTEEQVLEFANRLDANITFSSRRGPYVYITDLVDRDLKKLRSRKEEVVELLHQYTVGGSEGDEEAKERERRLEKELYDIGIKEDWLDCQRGRNLFEVVDSPGGMANVIKSFVNIFRKGGWGKEETKNPKVPYDVIWISERPTGELSSSRDDVPFREQYEFQYTLVREFPLDFTYTNFLWALRHNVRDIIDIEIPSTYTDYAIWEQFRNTNIKMGEAIAHEETSSPTTRPHISITHDYHLPFANYFAKNIMRDGGREIYTAHFDHIPWPNPEHFDRVFKGTEYLKFLLMGNEVYGLQSENDVKRFVATVEAYLKDKPSDEPQISEYAEVDWDDALDGFMVQYYQKKPENGERSLLSKTLVKSYPVGIDVDDLRNRATEPEVLERAKKFREDYEIPEDAILFYGIDRGGEQTKRVLQKLEDFEEYYSNVHSKQPDRVRDIILYQICDPSRQEIEEYVQRLNEIRESAKQINERAGRKLIILDDQWHPQDENLPLYLAGDFLWVNSIDGYNLVADEASALSTIGGHPTVPLVSKYTGCSNKLGGHGALVFDTFDRTDVLKVLDEAYYMPLETRREYAQSLEAVVRDRDINDYMGRFLNSIIQVCGAPLPRQQAPERPYYDAPMTGSYCVR